MRPLSRRITVGALVPLCLSACTHLRFGGDPTPAVVPPPVGGGVPTSVSTVPPTPGTGGSAGVVSTRRVIAKREPDKLLAEGGWSCQILPDFYKTIATGDNARCAWYRDPTP